MTASVRLWRAWPLLALAAASATSAQTTSLGTTIVSTTRFAEPADTLPIGGSLLTADDIRASGATTVNEALMRLLGVVGRQDGYGGGEYSLDLRGFGATADSNMVIVLDGQRLSEADQAGTRLSGIPINAVERIEVLRGSGAVLYGEGATGAVIVITTKAGLGRQQGNSATVEAGVGSLGLREGRASAALAAGGFALDLHAQQRDADNHRDNFRTEAGSRLATAQWSNDWLRLGVRHSIDNIDSRLPGALSASEYATDPRQTTKPNDWGRIEAERNSVFAEAQVGAWQLAANAGFRTKSVRSLVTYFGSSTRYDYDVEANNQGLRARHEGRWGDLRNVLVLGMDREHWDRAVYGAYVSRSNQDNRALYAKDDLTLSGGARLSAGVRTEKVEKSNTAADYDLSNRQRAWELGVSQPLTAQWSVHAQTGQSYRLANVDEIAYNTPVLLPQTSRDTQLGARWTHAAGRVEARVYRSLLTNEIGFDPDTYYNVNYAPTERRGLEVDAVQAVARNLNLRLNAAWRHSRFREGTLSGKDIPLAPRRSLALRADWTPAPSHRVSGGVVWVDTQYPDYANSCRIPSYANGDVRYAYQVGAMELSVAVANLADRKYYTQAYRCDGATPTDLYPEPGRTVRAGVRYTFR